VYVISSITCWKHVEHRSAAGLNPNVLDGDLAAPANWRRAGWESYLPDTTMPMPIGMHALRCSALGGVINDGYQTSNTLRTVVRSVWSIGTWTLSVPSPAFDG
jgi:hypothetical protein